MKIFGTVLDAGSINFLLALYIGCQKGVITNNIDQARVPIRKGNDLADSTAGEDFFFSSGHFESEGDIVANILVFEWADQVFHGDALQQCPVPGFVECLDKFMLSDKKNV